MKLLHDTLNTVEGLNMCEFLIWESQFATEVFEHPEPDYPEQVVVLDTSGSLFAIYDSWTEALHGIKEFHDEMTNFDSTISIREIPKTTGTRDGKLFIFVDDVAYFITPH